jgi:hypothetical protein
MVMVTVRSDRSRQTPGLGNFDAREVRFVTPCSLIGPVSLQIPMTQKFRPARKRMLHQQDGTPSHQETGPSHAPADLVGYACVPSAFQQKVTS